MTNWLRQVIIQGSILVRDCSHSVYGILSKYLTHNCSATLLQLRRRDVHCSALLNFACLRSTGGDLGGLGDGPPKFEVVYTAHAYVPPIFDLNTLYHKKFRHLRDLDLRYLNVIAF